MRALWLQRAIFAFTTGTDERSKAQVLHANIPVRQQVGLVTGRDHGVVIDASGAHKFPDSTGRTSDHEHPLTLTLGAARNVALSGAQSCRHKHRRCGEEAHV